MSGHYFLPNGKAKCVFISPQRGDDDLVQSFLSPCPYVSVLIFWEYW